MDPASAQDLVISQVTYSTLAVMALQWLKRSRFAPFITFETDALNKMVAAFFAAMTAVGIHAQYDSVAHTLMITNITFMAVAHGVWHFVQSFSFQELIYHGVLKPNPAPVVVAPVAPVVKEEGK